MAANHQIVKSGLSRRILKALSIFGGTQVLTILSSIVRTKLIAIWIGPAGIGLFGIFNMALDLISGVTEIGIRSSSVRDIASSNADPRRREEVIATVIRWMTGLGGLGALLTFLFAPLLSEYSFGDTSQAGGFRLLAAVVFLMAISSGWSAVLQGTGRLRDIARISVIGTFGGMIVSIPLFYYLRLDSIVLSILAYAAVTAGVTLAYRYRPPRGEEVPRVSLRRSWSIGRSFVVLGIFISVSDILGQLANYAFISWLNVSTDSTTVGYFQAGNTMIFRYVGLIFSAIAMEFYPRLSSNASSSIRTSVFVAHEIKVCMAVLVPFTILFIIFAPLIVRILYSDAFMPVVPYVTLGIVGTLFRAVSVSMAFVILARGDGRTYLLTETISAVTMLPIYIGCYKAWGIAGFGVAYTLWFALYTLAVMAIYYRRYGLRLGRRVSLFILGSIAAVTAAAVIALLVR